MNFKEKSNNKRISIDLSEELISKFDILKKEWGFSSRGSVIERLLNEVLKEDDLLPRNIQQTLNFDIDEPYHKEENFNDQSSLVLIKKTSNQEKDLNFLLKNQIEELQIKSEKKIDLPTFVDNKLQKLKRSLNSQNSRARLSDMQVNSLKKEETLMLKNIIKNYWHNLYENYPNNFIVESSMEWFSNEIWPNLEYAESIPFTWSAANKLMSEICPFWLKEDPSFEMVILIVGTLEDPFASDTLKNRIPTLIRRFVSRLKRVNRSNSFQALDSTMTVLGALRLLDLSTKAGSEHTLQKIKQAYKLKATKLHPDSGGSQEKMRQLNEAYLLLKNLYRNSL